MNQSDFNWFIAMLALMICCHGSFISTLDMWLMGIYLGLLTLGNMLK